MRLGNRISLLAVMGILLSCMGCSKGYEPGLGELMSLTQMRHAKLWFAVEAQNWDLADYELDELEEGFGDVVRFHPTHKDAPLPLSALVPKMMDEPLAELREAVKARDSKAFGTAFDAVTDACNSCHRATNFSFNVVRRPQGSPWFSNQDFAPGR